MFFEWKRNKQKYIWNVKLRKQSANHAHPFLSPLNQCQQQTTFLISICLLIIIAVVQLQTGDPYLWNSNHPASLSVYVFIVTISKNRTKTVSVSSQESIACASWNLFITNFRLFCASSCCSPFICAPSHRWDSLKFHQVPVLLFALLPIAWVWKFTRNSYIATHVVGHDSLERNPSKYFKYLLSSKN